MVVARARRIPCRSRNRSPRSARPRSGSPPGRPGSSAPRGERRRNRRSAAAVHAVLEHGAGAFVERRGPLPVRPGSAGRGSSGAKSDSKKASTGNMGRGKEVALHPGGQFLAQEEAEALAGERRPPWRRGRCLRGSRVSRAQVRSTRSSWRPISSSMGPPRSRRGRYTGENRGISGPGKSGSDRGKVVASSGPCIPRFFP